MMMSRQSGKNQLNAVLEAFSLFTRREGMIVKAADILLEIDKVQDVTPEKFDRDFRPMSATQNTTCVMYGTAWCDDALLETASR